MGIASELVLARNALLRSIRQGEEVPANLIEHVSACVTALQDGINRTRMQPMEALWTPLPRLVRDLAHELGKELDLTLEGGDTEIDRQLLEAIRDPIGHMVRNSADHGIEAPEERRRLGKRAAGSIRISARQSGGHIYLDLRSEEHTSELQSLMRISYAVFCLKKKTKNKTDQNSSHIPTRHTSTNMRPTSSSK